MPTMNFLSSEVDDFQAFTDAYLVLKGTGIDEEEARRCVKTEY